MKITDVKVRLSDNQNEVNKTVAWANITFDKLITIKNIILFRRKFGFGIFFPARKSKNNKYYRSITINDGDLLNTILEKIVEEYEKETNVRKV